MTAKITITVDTSDSQKNIDKIKESCKKAGAALVQMGKSISDKMKALLKYGTGVESLSDLFEIVRNALKEGMSTLATYDTETRKTLNRLKSSLAELKNSFAAAFQPILTAVAPLLTKLCDMLVTAANYIAMFWAVLTGGNTYKKLVAGQKNYNKSLSAGAGAAKKLVNNLSGLDEIHLWQDPTSSGSGGGGGSGADIDMGNLVEDVEVNSVVADFVNSLKAAFANGDFVEIGRIVGRKINEAIDSVNWTDIGSKLGYWVNVGVQAVYGFLDEVNFTGIGSHISEFLNGALEEIDFSYVGRLFVKKMTIIPDIIIGALTTLDWGLVASSFSDSVKGAFDEGTKWITSYDWGELATGLWNSLLALFKGIDWGGILSSASEFLGSASGAIAKFAWTLVESIGESIGDAFNSIGDYFNEQIDEAGGDIVAGIFNGIIDAVSNIGSWIKEHIFRPFIDGFKKAFGIASPAKNPELLEAAGYVGEGILNGIAAVFTNMKQWVKDNIMEPIKNALGTAKENVLEFKAKIITKLAELIADFKDKAIDFKAKLTEWTDSLKDKAVAFTAKLSGWISDFKTTLIGMTANFTGWIRSFATSVIGMTANFTGWIRSFATTLIGMTAKFTGWVRSFATSMIGMTAKFTGWVRNFKTNMITMSAKLTSWVDSMRDKTISFKANITEFVGNAGYKLKSWLGLATGGIYRNGRWQPIEGYASGGSPASARLFYANENGIPELVGRIGHNTAVMNNGQIVASVAAGVYRAVASVFGQLGGYFAMMTNRLGQIPPAIEMLAAMPAVTPTPVMATGTVIPPKTLYVDGPVQGLADAVAGLRDMLGLTGGVERRQSQEPTYNVSINLDGRAVYKGVLQRGRLQQMQTGSNPFDLGG